VDEEAVQRDMLDWLGPTLAKACADPFDYLVVLRNGQRLRFYHAEYVSGSQWITLLPLGAPDGEWQERPSGVGLHPCPRGIDVRLSDILFAVDAPDGS
jgi:hypothetical protein